MENETVDTLVQKQLDANAQEAEELLQDEDKMERVLERLERKLDKIPVLGNVLANVPMLISLVRAYMKKEYTDIPMGSLIAIVGGLIYFLSPVDLIPDNIPGVGYLDDGAVMLGVLKLVHDDVEEYKEWQRANDKRIFEDEPKSSKRKEKQEMTK